MPEIHMWNLGPAIFVDLRNCDYSVMLRLFDNRSQTWSDKVAAAGSYAYAIAEMADLKIVSDLD